MDGLRSRSFSNTQYFRFLHKRVLVNSLESMNLEFKTFKLDEIVLSIRKSTMIPNKEVIVATAPTIKSPNMIMVQLIK